MIKRKRLLLAENVRGGRFYCVDKLSFVGEFFFKNVEGGGTFCII